MRRLIILFIFIFLGSNYFNANAETHIVKNYHVTHQFLENSEQQDLVTKSDEFSIFKANRINERNDDIITEENDDDDFVSVKRYNLTTNYFGILIYAFVLSFFYQLKTSVLPFGKHLSYIFPYKYILLRVLKI
jgi:hypothetical protein